MRKFILLFLIFSLSTLLFACMDDSAVIINMEEGLVTPGRTVNLSASRIDGEEFPEGTTFTWEASRGELSSNNIEDVNWTAPNRALEESIISLIVEQPGLETVETSINIGTVIFTDFSVDPVQAGWYYEDNNTVDFYYNNQGWLEVYTKRDTNSSRICYPLPRPLSYDDEFWLEMDVEPNEIAWLFAGVTNSFSDNMTTSIGFAGTTTNRYDPIFIGDNDGFAHAKNYINGQAFGEGDFKHRIKMHYSYNQSIDSGELNFVVIDLETNEIVRDLIMVYEEMSDNFKDRMDVIYIGNRTDGDQDRFGGPTNFDNIYFSLTGPNNNPIAPSF